MKQLIVKEGIVLFVIVVILSSYLMYLVTYLGAYLSPDKTIVVGIDWFGETKYEVILNLSAVILSLWAVPYILKNSIWKQSNIIPPSKDGGFNGGKQNG